ncbi:MAG: hypothetical protein JWQ87_1278 [Candidatus Sulfotelmatobacter sp.]|nr:hypothetical protein [Candidatus Sulfotelmatobacter sp.]
MNKADMAFLTFPVEQICSDRPLCNPWSTFNWQIQDERLPHLLVVLQQLDESMHGLEGLPEPEASEIVSAALRVCGFVEPIEAFEVIAAILNVLETLDPFSERPTFPGYVGTPS